MKQWVQPRDRDVCVLLIDDNAADALLAREAITGAADECGIDLVIVADGGEALDYVAQRGPYANARRPDLILLDLNLPGLSGKDVLAAIKSSTATRAIPVVVFSASLARSDIAESYELGANCFIPKPLEFDAYVESLKSLDRFWFTSAALPESLPLEHSY